MLVQRKNLPLKITLWLITEVVLALVELDVMPDYSEFIFTQKNITIISYPPELAATIPPSCRWMFGSHLASDKVSEQSSLVLL